MRGFGRGFQIVEGDDGVIRMHYAEHSRYVFASPKDVAREFDSWDEVIAFLRMWVQLEKIQWWKTTKESE